MATKKPAKKTATKKTATKKTATKKAPAKTSKKSVVDVGAPAPSFSLAGDDGKTHSLQGYAGKPIVLYFYPKDDTPGCTVEACDFRDNLARATAKGAVVLGVSKDTVASHAKFRAKYGLTFPLLSDVDLEVHRAYGAWGKKVMYGKEVEGTIRSTFLIDKDGTLARAWMSVKVEGHADKVLEALAAL